MHARRLSLLMSHLMTHVASLLEQITRRGSKPPEMSSLRHELASDLRGSWLFWRALNYVVLCALDGSVTILMWLV